jgi:hypothetical protein
LGCRDPQVLDIERSIPRNANLAPITLAEALADPSGAGPHALNLQTACWEQIAPLFAIAHAIKDVDSPVFGSKLCHFLLPDAFPVIDRSAVGLGWRSYEEYWRYCHEQWVECSQKSDLTDALRREVGFELMPSYPFTTKLTELCLIGSRAASSRSFR